MAFATISQTFGTTCNIISFSLSSLAEASFARHSDPDRVAADDAHDDVDRDPGYRHLSLPNQLLSNNDFFSRVLHKMAPEILSPKNL